MRLQKIILINRAPFEHLELNFDNENLGVLSGINGSGKTTIISYIVDSFYELAKSVFTQEFKDRANDFYRISSRIYSIDIEKVSIVYLRYINDDGYIADFIDIRGKCSKEEYNNILSLTDKISYSILEKELKDGRVNKYWTLKNKNEITKLFSNNILTYFPAYRYEIPSFLNNYYTPKLHYKKEMDFADYLYNPIEVTSDLPEVSNWIMDVVLDRYLYEGKSLNMFSQLNDLLTSILLSKFGFPTRFGVGMRTSGIERIAVMDRNIEGHCIYPSIFNMSSGELALLCLFGEVIRQADMIGKMPSNITGIVLVDEIDKHLHIKLQKEILPKLFAMFPKIQFIVSTHSPFLNLGLSDNKQLSYKIYDLDNDGKSCLPLDNKLFNEVYEMLVPENENFAKRYNQLKDEISKNTKPLVITEGKTDWKHIDAAISKLGINDIDISFYDSNDDIGDDALLKMLKAYARIEQPRIIIGIFDRDNLNALKCKGLESNEYLAFGNNVFAFAIPSVNANEYGVNISIEHYYKKDDLTKADKNGRRIFLGSEFYESGINISNNHIHASNKSGIEHKVKNNGIVDKNVYDTSTDPEEQHSIALTKNDFADLIYNKDEFAKDFDFSEFQKIIDVIKKIISENTINPAPKTE